MTKTIYYTAVNGHDGSASVAFFECGECIDLLEEHDPETYSMGEGGSSFVVNGTTDLQVRTLASVKKQVEDEDYDCWSDPDAYL